MAVGNLMGHHDISGAALKFSDKQHVNIYCSNLSSYIRLSSRFTITGNHKFRDILRNTLVEKYLAANGLGRTSK